MTEAKPGKAFPLIRAMLIGGISEEARSRFEDEEPPSPDQVTGVLVEAARLTLEVNGLLEPIAQRLAGSGLSPSMEAIARVVDRFPLSPRIAVTAEVIQINPPQLGSRALASPVEPEISSQTPVGVPEAKKRRVSPNRLLTFLDNAVKVQDGKPMYSTLSDLVETTFADLLAPLMGDPNAYSRKLESCKKNAELIAARISLLAGVDSADMEGKRETTKAAVNKLRTDPTLSLLKGGELRKFLLRRSEVQTQPRVETTLPQVESKERFRDLTDKEIETVLGFLKIAPDRKTTLAQGSSTKVARIIHEELIKSGIAKPGSELSNMNSAQASIYKRRDVIREKVNDVLKNITSGDNYPGNVLKLLETLGKEPEYQGINLRQIVDLMYNRVLVEEVHKQNKDIKPNPQNPAKPDSSLPSDGRVVNSEALLKRWEVTDQEFGVALCALSMNGSRRVHSSVEDLVIDTTREVMSEITDPSKRVANFEEFVDYTKEVLGSVSDKLTWGRGSNRLRSQLPAELSKLIDRIHSITDGSGNRPYENMSSQQLRRALLFET